MSFYFLAYSKNYFGVYSRGSTANQNNMQYLSHIIVKIAERMEEFVKKGKLGYIMELKNESSSSENLRKKMPTRKKARYVVVVYPVLLIMSNKLTD